MKRLVMVWDGEHIPEVLRKTPPGKYRLQVVEDAEPLSEAEDDGIRQALDQLDAGQGLSLADVTQQIRGRARRR